MNQAKKNGALDFSQPIMVLKQCHDRIRKQLHLLETMATDLSHQTANAQTRQTAADIVLYFGQAAPLHHADEEDDLIPMLQARAKDADAALLALMVPALTSEHAQMAQLWQVIAAQLNAVATGSGVDLGMAPVRQFSMLYAAHMDTEETHIATMAKRLLGRADLELLGTAMRARRSLGGAALPEY